MFCYISLITSSLVLTKVKKPIHAGHHWAYAFTEGFEHSSWKIGLPKREKISWLVVSTHLKNISQNGNLPQIGMKIKNVWNHQPVVFQRCYTSGGDVGLASGLWWGFLGRERGSGYTVSFTRIKSYPPRKFGALKMRLISQLKQKKHVFSSLWIQSLLRHFLAAKSPSCALKSEKEQ